jgi:hypothetical protein
MASMYAVYFSLEAANQSQRSDPPNHSRHCFQVIILHQPPRQTPFKILSLQRRTTRVQFVLLGKKNKYKEDQSSVYSKTNDSFTQGLF